MKMRIIILTFILNFFLVTNAYSIDYLKSSMKLSAAGMKAQEARLRIISENIANKDSVSVVPGGEPYKRQIIILQAKNNRKLGAKQVIIKKYGQDTSQLRKIYDPSHPAADKLGYVLYPNVNIHMESADSKDAAKTYEANLNMLDLNKNIYNKTLEMLR